MALARFLIRLLPPRPTFVQDMTDAERAIMTEHVAYWTGLRDQGVAIAFGPVIDPSGPWGLGLVEVEHLDAVAAVIADDPAIRANAGFRTEVLPMATAVVRPFLRA